MKEKMINKKEKRPRKEKKGSKERKEDILVPILGQ